MPESVEFGESKMSHRSRKARVANDDETSSSDGDSSDIVVQASCVESRISDGKGRISEENRKRNVPTAGADDSDSDAEYKEEQEQEQKQRRTETITDDEVVPAPEEWDDPEAEPHVIVVGRDYAMHDGANLTRFQRIFPRRLRAAGVRRRKWERTIDQINAYFEEAEALDCTAFMEGCIGCLTAFTLFLCYEHRYKRILRQLDDFLEEENEMVYRKHGLEILNPLANGLLQIEIRILNPPDEV